ncbi:MAG: DUF1540 domain-containing protein [Clostridiales bacterium]|nr:DUF1540 domain-containing protein [Clostridiales bacterium]
MGVLPKGEKSMLHTQAILCSVKGCRHNANGKSCALKDIHVGCACGESCTCCDSYEEK